jgi:hypothetical protein
MESIGNTKMKVSKLKLGEGLKGINPVTGPK